MSFADEAFDFPEEPGLNLVCGRNNDIPGSKNGTGKSNIANALCYSLFGQTKDNLKNENIHNKYIAGKDVRVVTFFSVDDHNYRIASGFNKYGHQYCELVEIVDGEEVDLAKSSLLETRKFLADEILHCDMSIFLRTVLLSSDNNYNFFRLRKGEKKEFIEKLFDISIFGNMYNLIHRDVLSQDKQLLVQQNNLMNLNKTHDEYLKQIEEYNIKIESQKNELQKTLNETIAAKDELVSKNCKINDEEVEKYQHVVEKITEAIDLVTEKIRSMNDALHKISLATHKKHTSKEQKQKLIDKHSVLMNKLCDDCKTIFKEHYSITTYADEISAIDNELKVLQEKETIAENQKQQLNSKQTELSAKLKLANKKIIELTEQYNKTHKEISLYEAKIVNIEQQLSRLTTESNPYTALFDKNEEKLNSAIDELNLTSEKYRYLKFAENIVSQDTLRKFIISDLVGLLNNKIKTYLTKFGARYHVIFDSDMNYEFITEGGKCEYDNFSSGERARIMIASCFAFRDFMYIRNNMSSNILFLDEFIDGAIDSMAIESILDVLKSFSENWQQNIYIVSHRKEVNNDVFNRIIQVQKTNNISKIHYL